MPEPRRPGAARRGGAASTRCTYASALAVGWYSSPSSSPPRRSSPNTRTSPGFATSWVDHAQRYVEMITERLQLGQDDLVVELASNDGYLLQHFVGTGIPILGIEPCCERRRRRREGSGVPTLVEFFGRADGRAACGRGETRRASSSGTMCSPRYPTSTTSWPVSPTLLAPQGTATFEFPHLAPSARASPSTTRSTTSTSRTSRSRRPPRSWLRTGCTPTTWRRSRRTAARFASTLSTVHGPHAESAAVAELVAREEQRGLRTAQAYARFASAVNESKRALLELLIELRRAGRRSRATARPARATRS